MFKFCMGFEGCIFGSDCSNSCLLVTFTNRRLNLLFCQIYKYSRSRKYVVLGSNSVSTNKESGKERSNVFFFAEIHAITRILQTF